MGDEEYSWDYFGSQNSPDLSTVEAVENDPTGDRFGYPADYSGNADWNTVQNPSAGGTFDQNPAVGAAGRATNLGDVTDFLSGLAKPLDQVTRLLGNAKGIMPQTTNGYPRQIFQRQPAAGSTRRGFTQILSSFTNGSLGGKPATGDYSAKATINTSDLFVWGLIGIGLAYVLTRK